jgi:hypothetical protein
MDRGEPKTTDIDRIRTKNALFFDDLADRSFISYLRAVPSRP